MRMIYLIIINADLKSANKSVEVVMKVSEKKPFIVILENEKEYHELEDSFFGLCFNCGEEHYNCEPDASNYTCDSCGKSRVYGMMNLLMANRIMFLPEVE
jgi:hypothetical protein